MRFLPIKSQSINTILFLEGIEHLSKEEGCNILRDLEKIACNRIIITTPVGFIEQGGYEGNPFQLHKSSWLPDEFRRLGYNIYPTEFKYPASLKYPFNYIKILIRQILTPVFYPIMKVNPNKFCSRAIYIKEIHEK